MQQYGTMDFSTKKANLKYIGETVLRKPPLVQVLLSSFLFADEIGSAFDFEISPFSFLIEATIFHI